MTDKQIIIDGVDVRGCIYLKKNNRMPMCRACNSGVGSPYCGYHKDCYYKQLKHKEQEYEILNIEIEENEKLKQTLKEIKEIVRQEIDSKEFMLVQCMLNGNVDDKNKVLKQILQKISKYEVKNDNRTT